MRLPKLAAFTGLRPEAFAFLRELSEHNSRPWFQTHRDEYEDHLLAPLRALVLELTPAMVQIDAGLEVTPAVGKAISRIHRDTRFSRDPSPYRDHMWVVFANPAVPAERPAFFFEFGPRICRYGMGFYSLNANRAAWIRARMDASPNAFAGAVAPLPAAGLRLVAEPYAKSRAAHLPEVLRPYYDARRFHMERVMSEAAAGAPDLAEELQAGFRVLAPLYHLIRGEAAAAPQLPPPPWR